MNAIATPQAAATAPAAAAAVARQLVGLRTAQRLYQAEFAACPRSKEWKLGARAGVWKALGLTHPRSPYASASAQDDAWRSGYHIGFGEVRHLQDKGAA